jgi:aspartyl-tRNA(Asn)/glutamyl-tRNA(Gln) amidotransferase subunit A
MIPTEIENKKYTIAYYPETIELEGLDSEIKTKFTQYLDNLKADGHTLVPISFQYLQEIVPVYYILTTAEASSNLARFDGVRFGMRSSNATDLESTYKKTRSEGFGKEVKRRVMLGTFVLSSGYYDAYYTKAQQVRRLIHDETIAAFETCDFIITPATPTPAFDLGAHTKDPVAMYLADIYTVQANIVGIPAISLPILTHSNGLPFGIQLMANKFDEKKLFQFSKQLLS